MSVGRAVLAGAAIALGSLLLFVIFFIYGASRLPAGVQPTLCLWDCSWYVSIARQGYGVAPEAGTLYANFGFFPAFPMLIALTSRLSGLAVENAALLANACLAAGFCSLALRHRVALRLPSEADAVVFLLAFLLSPWSLYNHVGYSEMLFNFAALGTFLCWRQGRMVPAALFGVLLTATRVTGVLLPLVLVVGLILARRRRLAELLAAPDGRIRALAVMPLGLMAFTVFLYWRVGDPLAYFHVQQVAWTQHLNNPLEVLAASIEVYGRPLYDVLAFFAITVVLGIGAASRRIPVELAAFAWLAPALSMMSVPPGEPRYALSIFPIYLLVTALPPRIVRVVIPLLAMGQFFLTSAWVLGAGWLT